MTESDLISKEEAGKMGYCANNCIHGKQSGRECIYLHYGPDAPPHHLCPAPPDLRKYWNDQIKQVIKPGQKG